MGRAVDWTGFAVRDFAPEWVEAARAEWLRRVHTEFRSIQIMTRFLEEVVAAGDPVDVYASAVDAVRDEIRHVALCAEVCARLGVEATLPSPVPEPVPERFRTAPPADRASSTALSMLAINETISVAFIGDLAQRCSTPGIREVLQQTIADEDAHGDFGWDYVTASLSRYPDATLSSWRHLVQTTLAPHLRHAQLTLAELPEEQRHLEAHPDVEEVRLGLFSPARQALIFQRVWETDLRPRLARSNLLEDPDQGFQAE